MAEEQQKGRRMLEEIAARHAQGHGLRNTEMVWEEIGDEFFLVVRTEAHAVRIPFSGDEIEALDQEDVARSARHKIRDKFAGLSI
jgi:hypothetical protein